MGAGVNIRVIAVAAGAVLLQLMLAPYIAIGGAMPNFVAAAAIVIAIVRHDRFGFALPFVMGLLYDLFSGNPVGCMAFTLLLVSYITSRLFSLLNNDTVLMAVLVAAAALLAVEVLYGVLLLMFGYAGGALSALVYRALPSFVYDLVIAVILSPLFKRLFAETTPVQSAITRLR